MTPYKKLKQCVAIRTNPYRFNEPSKEELRQMLKEAVQNTNEKAVSKPIINNASIRTR